MGELLQSTPKPFLPEPEARLVAGLRFLLAPHMSGSLEQALEGKAGFTQLLAKRRLLKLLGQAPSLRRPVGNSWRPEGRPAPPEELTLAPGAERFLGSLPPSSHTWL